MERCVKMIPILFHTSLLSSSTSIIMKKGSLSLLSHYCRYGSIGRIRHRSAVSSFSIQTTISRSMSSIIQQHQQHQLSVSQSCGISPEVQTQVLDTCAELHSSIMTLNEKLHGPLAKNSVS